MEYSILGKIPNPKDSRILSERRTADSCRGNSSSDHKSNFKNGGHVGPNLGVVELTIALHLAFDSPHDQFCWDVSHQGYVHKLLPEETINILTTSEKTMV